MSAMDYSTPARFQCGVLPRISKFASLPSMPPARDVLGVLSEDECDEILAAEDNRPDWSPSVPWTFAQDYNSCAAESYTGLFQTLRAAFGEPFVQLNPLPLYALCNRGRDRGAPLDKIELAAQEHGLIPEKVWPYSKGWSRKPPASAWDAAQDYRTGELLDLDNTSDEAFWTDIRTALCRRDGLIHFGYYVDDDPRAGHAVFGTSLLPRKSKSDPWIVTFKNSWSATWGENGFGAIPLRKIQRVFGGAIVRAPRTSTAPADPSTAT